MADLTQTVIAVGEKIHIIMRRHFKEDIRRHFAGTVTAVSEGQIRAEGYTFVFNPATLEYRKLPELRTRIFGILDSGYVINVLPENVVVDRLHYHTNLGAPVITDGAGFRLEVNEQNA
jgi:hypothetical protein